MNTLMNLLPSNWLRNTLLASGNINFEEVYILPDFTKSTDSEIPKKKIKTTVETLKVFPNPAREYIVIEYLTNKDKNDVIIITDGMGRLVDKISIGKDADQILYITKSLKPGLYNCSLSLNGRIKSNVKFTVIR